MEMKPSEQQLEHGKYKENRKQRNCYFFCIAWKTHEEISCRFLGMAIGYCIVRAEPAVQVLVKQVEEVSNGSIAQKTMQTALSVGIAAAVGLSMLIGSSETATSFA